jgi:hypothetical protein
LPKLQHNSKQRRKKVAKNVGYLSNFQKVSNRPSVENSANLVTLVWVCRFEIGHYPGLNPAEEIYDRIEKNLCYAVVSA